jgi:hypothetical protein
LASPILNIEREEMIAPAADPEEEREELQKVQTRNSSNKSCRTCDCCRCPWCSEWTRASIEYPPLTGYVPMQTWSVKNMVQDKIVPGQNTAVT